MNIQLPLTGITPSGDAIGRHQGMVVFVPLGLPNETVEIEIVEQRRNFGRGRIVRVIQPAPERVTPRCRHFGVWGGCQWQQIDYAAQLRFKTEIVREQLARIGKIADPPVLPCIPSPLPYGYRNHARLALAASGRLGYRAAAARAIVEIDECPILEDGLMQQISEKVLGDKMVNLSASELQAPELQASELQASEDVEIRWQEPSIRVGEHDFFVSPSSSFQANSAIAATMIDLVLAALQLRGEEAVLDLYCGVGLFTLPIAQRAARVIGIEANATVTADARHNLATINRQQRNRAQIITAAVEGGLQQPVVKATRWNAIVLDPPRAGVAARALQQIIDFRASKLVYVSCDSATLARDLRVLLDHGYQLLSAQPLDMFPQTYHVETVAVLRKL